MATKPNQHTKAQKFENTYGQIETPADLPYGPGSPDYMLGHKRFKRFGGPEMEVPAPGGDNSFWNLYFGLTPGQPTGLEYKGPAAPPLRPNLGPRGSGTPETAGLDPVMTLLSNLTRKV